MMHCYYRLSQVRIQNSLGIFNFSESEKIQGINGENGRFSFVYPGTKLDQTTELTPFK